MSNRRRRFPWLLLFAAFLLVPLIEIYVLIQVGQVIGVWWTILLLIADSLFGSWLIKREGGRAWTALRVALEKGRMPAKELADGMLILIGGTLMLTPGFVSDAIGLLAILPFTRPFGRRLLARVVSRKLVGSVSAFGPTTGPAGPQNGQQKAQRPGSHDVIQGEVID